MTFLNTNAMQCQKAVQQPNVTRAETLETIAMQGCCWFCNVKNGIEIAGMVRIH